MFKFFHIVLLLKISICKICLKSKISIAISVFLHCFFTFKNGKERIRVIFHLKGSRTRGVAQAEKEFYDGDWRWRFLLIQTDGNPYETHIIIDNRV